jgi:hypothetical protein
VITKRKRVGTAGLNPRALLAFKALLEVNLSDLVLFIPRTYWNLVHSIGSGNLSISVDGMAG